MVMEIGNGKFHYHHNGNGNAHYHYAQHWSVWKKASNVSLSVEFPLSLVSRVCFSCGFYLILVLFYVFVSTPFIPDIWQSQIVPLLRLPVTILLSAAASSPSFPF